MALTGKRILLGITGGIAAYKAAELARLLIKDGAFDPDYGDEIVSGTVITRGGDIVHEMTKQRLAEAGASAPGASVQTLVAAEAKTAGLANGAAPAAPATSDSADAAIPARAVAGDGSSECPADYPIKGNASSSIFHEPGSGSYGRTIPEFCFNSVQAAEAAGYRASRA